VTALHIIVGLIGLAVLVGVQASVLRSVVLPRAVPARLARIAFLGVRFLLLTRLRLQRCTDYLTRDRVLALQAPLGLFGELFTWALLIYLGFAAIFWAITPRGPSGGVAGALEMAGSDMFTLGFDRPHGLFHQLVSFAAAGVGLTLLALVITYLPSVYGTFARREALITRLVVRAGSPPSGLSLLVRSWELARFERLEEVWNAWESWFVDVGESHTTFPQLSFFRSPHPHNHWVLSAEAVLDGANLLMTTCDVPRQSRSELCVDAGVAMLVSIADFLGIAHEPPAEDATEVETVLPADLYVAACRQLERLGVPVHQDHDTAWRDFRRMRARYEPLIAVLGRMTDAPRSNWSSWSEETPRHSPPLIRVHKR
jgi:hypothetical protein